MSQLDIAEETERHYQAGYRANSVEDCPYKRSGQGPYVLWMQGYTQHQADRERVAAMAAKPYCRKPLA